MCIQNYTINPNIPDLISLQVDVNGTMTFFDGTKSCNPVISEVAAQIKAVWKERLSIMSYKDFIQKYEIPGNKYDKEIREKQEAKIDQFLHFLKETNHPLKEEALQLYQKLSLQYIDPQTGKVPLVIFPSIQKLIKKINEYCLCIFTCRTFGPDGEVLKKECDALSKDENNFGKNRLYINRQATFNKDGMKVEGQNKILTGEQLFETLLEEHTIGLDDFTDWRSKEGNRQAMYGKKIYCVKDGKFNGKTVLTIFLDDNLNKSKKSEKGKVANPHEQNIAFPVDIYNREISWDDKGIIGIKINTLKAAMDVDYPIKKINKQLIERGFIPLSLS